MRIIVPIVFASLFLQSCKHEQSTSDASGRLPFGNIDAPKDNSEARGSVILGGWALCEDGIQRVRFYLDRQFVVEATLGVSRPDVAKVFPAIEGNGSSGWGGVVDLSKVSPGQHQLIVQARSNTGATADLGVRNIVVVK